MLFAVLLFAVVGDVLKKVKLQRTMYFVSITNNVTCDTCTRSSGFGMKGPPHRNTRTQVIFFTFYTSKEGIADADKLESATSIIFPCERSDAGEYGFCTYGRIGQSEEG